MANKIPDLYYYTTVDTMKYILQDGNIYATNLRYMNDSEEYSNGLTELKKILNESYPQTVDTINDKAVQTLKEGDTEIYSISFSMERDLLSQWSMYAKESGVSLKMDFNCEMHYCFYPSEPKEPQKNKREFRLSGIYPQKVYYLTEKAMCSRDYVRTKKEIVKSIESRFGKTVLDDMEDENEMMVWHNMIPYVKRYEFKAEGEYRLAYSFYDMFTGAVRIDYRNDKNVLKPYLDVECENGWPVREVIVGPGFNQQVVFMSLKHYFCHTKLKVPFIDGSEFQKACRDFLKINNQIPAGINKVWKLKKKKLKDPNIDARYTAFEKIVDEIMNDNAIDDKYKNQLKNRYLSKDGILLSKSEIPYIY